MVCRQMSMTFPPEIIRPDFRNLLNFYILLDFYIHSP